MPESHSMESRGYRVQARAYMDTATVCGQTFTREWRDVRLEKGMGVPSGYMDRDLHLADLLSWEQAMTIAYWMLAESSNSFGWHIRVRVVEHRFKHSWSHEQTGQYIMIKSGVNPETTTGRLLSFVNNDWSNEERGS